MGWTADRSSVQFVETVSGLISLTASLYCAAQIKPQRNGTYNLTDSMLIVILIVDVVLSILFIIGSSAALNDGFCQFQAFFIQWFALAGIFWLACNSYQLYKWVVKKKSVEGIRKKLKKYAIACFLLSGIIAVSLLGADKYGDDYVWCWIAPNSTNTSPDNWLRFGCFYLFLIIAMVYNALVLRAISGSISKRVEHDQKQSGKESELIGVEIMIRNQLRMYQYVFMFSWSWFLLNGLVQAVTNRKVIIVALLQAAFVPSQGLLNALVYGGILNEDTALRVWLHRNMQSVHDYLFPVWAAATGARRRQSQLAAQNMTRSNEYESAKFSILTTTLNCGEAPFEQMKSALDRWILKGHDIYVVGVQECLDLEQVREGILQHLGGPSEYVLYTEEIGSNNTSLGFHGYIGLTVFLKASHVSNGILKATAAAVPEIAAGANLGVYTAANKGGVGIPVQIHDTSISFVTVHLPSDSKGVSKLAKRNAAAETVLKELTLASNDYNFDSHLQHDHLVFMGDLNYRMDATATEVSALTGVSNAAELEKQAFGDDPNWVRRKYAKLCAPTSPEYPSAEEMRVIERAEEESRAAWAAVLHADELVNLLQEGAVFSGFVEPPPSFPPSYKRKTGSAGDCGDYTDPVVMIGGFCNTGEVEMDEDEELVARAAGAANPGTAVKDPKDPSVSDGGVRESDVRESDVRMSDVRMSDVRLSESLPPPAAVAGSPPNPRSGGGRKRRQSVVMKLPENASKKEIKAIRPPSYTDRILVHSLPDRADKLKIVGYDLCDEMRISDHRAATMILQLEVNSKITGPAPLPNEFKLRKSAFPLAGTTIEFVEVCLSEIHIELLQEDPSVTNRVTGSSNPMLQDAEAGDAAGPGCSSKVDHITAVFPIPSKDPMVTYREMYDVCRALKISTKAVVK